MTSRSCRRGKELDRDPNQKSKCASESARSCCRNKESQNFCSLSQQRLNFHSCSISVASQLQLSFPLNFGSQLIDQPLSGALLIVPEGGNWQRACWLLKLLFQSDTCHFLSCFIKQVTNLTLTLMKWGNTIKALQGSELEKANSDTVYHTVRYLDFAW